MELFDLYDKAGNLIGKTMYRGGTNMSGEYHLVTHIWIRNTSGEYLIQQRNKLDDPIPFQWAATGGAVITGETSIEATRRETKEELGLDLPEEEFVLVKRYYIDNPKANYITDLYLVKKDLDIDKLVLDKNEVLAVSFKNMKEIKEMIKTNDFWDYTHNMERSDYFDILEKS